jgi:hypothetical protein
MKQAIKKRCSNLVRYSGSYTRAQKEVARRYIELAADVLFIKQSSKRPSLHAPLEGFGTYLARKRFLKHHEIPLWEERD